MHNNNFYILRSVQQPTKLQIPRIHKNIQKMCYLYNVS